MHHTRYLPIFLLLTAIISSCRTTSPIVSSPGGEATAQAYVEKYKELAVSEMKRTGVPASITLAQGMIESDFGRSRLATEANNHFGIKCHSDWKGPTIRHNDDRRNECFRKYSRPEESFYDHSDFLRSGSRYSSLFELERTDYKGWARGLKKAGYATNPDYAEMLIRKIEENSLYNYDSGKITSENNRQEQQVVARAADKTVYGNSGSGKTTVNELTAVPARPQRIFENNRIQYIIVKDGETREMIEKEFQLLKWELPRYNDLPEDFIPKAGQTLYLQPKRDKAEPGKEVHKVTAGDSLYVISQKYGIKLKSLMDYNRLSEGSEPVPGDSLWLRAPKPVR